MLTNWIQERIVARASAPSFQNYLQVRPVILSMLQETENPIDTPSAYWEEELSGFEYLLDATPTIISGLRQHCYHITGLRSYEYRRHHAHMKPAFESKLKALKTLDHRGLFVPEAPEMGGFGHVIDGRLVNLDTLKFYESLIAMDLAGFLDFTSKSDLPPPVIMEIGAGWGGFAYQFKTLFPRSCYIIVDLPQTMLISAVYLKTLFPKCRFAMYGEIPEEDILSSIRNWDFVFLPHYILPKLGITGIDLAINMVSFQEMTTEQVSGYLEWLFRQGCPSIYSHNRDRSKHNQQISSVSQLLARYYSVRELTLLPVPYTVMTIPSAPKFKMPKNPTITAVTREAIKHYLRVTEKKKTVATDYRHFAGTIRSSAGAA